MSEAPHGPMEQPSIQRVADDVPAVVYVHDLVHDRPLFVSSHVQLVLGRTPGEITALGERFVREVMHPDDQPAIRTHFARVREAGDGIELEVEYRMRHADGTWRWFQARNAVLARDAAGVPTQLIGCAFEITARKDAERTLRESELRLRELADGAPVMLWLSLANGDATYVNRTLLEFLGRRLEDCLRFGWRDTVHPDDQPTAAERFREAAATGAEFQMELRVRRHDGEFRWMLVTARPQRDAEGRVTGFIGSNVDITERRHAVAEREQAAELLQAIMGSVPDLVWVKDREGRVTHANRATVELLGGGDPAAVLGRAAAELIPDAEQAVRILENDQRIMREGHPELVEERVGDPRAPLVFQSVKAPLRDPAGRVIGIVGVSRDVTERRRTEDLAHEAEERLRFALDAAYMIAFEWDIVRDEVRRPFSNEAALPATPDTAPERFEDVARVVHPEDRALFRANVQQALAHPDGDYRSEFRVIAPDGSVRWLLERGRVEFGADGRPIRLTGLSQDVTDRSEAVARLRETESTLRSFYESSPLLMGVVELAPGGGDIVHLYDNPATARFFGRAPGDTEGQSAAELGAAASVRQLWVASYREAERTREPVRFDYRHPSAERELWLSVVVAYIGPSANGSARFSYVAEDVTARKLAEQGLREDARRKDEFLATLAHELRNPLAPLRHAAQLLEMQGADTPAARFAHDIIERQMSHMVRLIDDLLDVSRITRGKLELRREPVDLRTVLEAAVETSQPHVERERHQLELVLGEPGVRLVADPVRLAQVFANLLNNASKFTAPGGAIRLSARREGTEAVVTVSDTGIGFAPAEADRLFEMFMQVGRPLDRAHGGLGIGLTLAKRIVEMHGGRISARSAGPGQGSTFEVRLPLAETPSAATRGRPIRAPDGGALPCRVLVVDDNADAAATLEMLLQLRGCITEVAHDGAAAVAAAERMQPDAVLLDIGMPRMNGYEACRAIREQTWGRSMLLVALTGWGQEEDRRQSQAAGFDAHFVKPVDIEELMPLLDRAAAGAR